MVSIGLTIFPAEAGCSNVRDYQSTAVRFVINDLEILSAQPVDDEVAAEPSMAAASERLHQRQRQLEVTLMNVPKFGTGR